MSLIGLLLFFNFSIFTGWNKINISPNNEATHNWKLIEDLLTEGNYDLIWINPEEYETFELFLNDFNDFSWVPLDSINEKFVIWIKSEDWKDITFVPFDLKNSDNLFNDSNNKNLAILDIYKSYKEWLLYWWFDSQYNNKIIFEKDIQHPKTAQLNTIFDVNIADQSNNIFDIMNWLNKSDDIWIWNTELLAYLNDFTWNYDEASKNRYSICEKYNQNCEKYITLNISWKVLDSKWNPVKWARIELLNNRNFNSKTDSEWNYKLRFNHFPFSHLRFKTSFTWYSDWFTTVSLNKYNSSSANFTVNFKIQEAENIFSINENNKSEYKKWRYYIIEDKFSKYFIPMNGLNYIDWRKYNKNDFLVYTYLFKKSSNMDSMLENDTFEPVYWYVWNIMKTFGMPYIQFVDRETWSELYIKSSNPMILQNKIYHMKELYENTDQIYERLTKEDMKFLVQKSEELWWYPINFEFLTENEFLRWPAWWSLDRVTWIWSNVGSRVINVDWLVELPFYHVNDN